MDNIEEHLTSTRHIMRAVGFILGSSSVSIPNISRGEMGVLGYLVRSGRTSSPRELAAELGVTPSRIANTLKSLDRKGLIVRERNEDDRRGVIVRITPEGAQFAEHTFHEAIDECANTLMLLDPSERDELERIVSKIVIGLARRDGLELPAYLKQAGV